MSDQRSTTVMFLVAICALLIEHGQPRMVGAPIDAELSEDKKQELIGYVLEEFHATSNSLYKYEAANITNVRSQVVAGVKYYLTTELAETTCLKDNSNAGEECKRTSPDGSSNLFCEAEIYMRPWENFKKTKITNCTNKKGEVVSSF